MSSGGDKRTGGSVGVDGFGSQDVCIVGVEGAKSGGVREGFNLSARKYVYRMTNW